MSGTLPRRWLVTGGGGQLGRSFVAVARERGLEAVPLARDALDVTREADVARALAEVRPAAVLHCAAMTDVDGCERDPEAARLANAVAPALLAERCRGRALFVHVSTDYVFDVTEPVPIDEDAPPRPRSVYGRTKLEGERAVRAAGGEHLVVRTQWLFGPGRNFVRTILEAARAGRSLRVVEDQLGRPTWSGALARAILDALERGARGTLHLACEGVASWFDLAAATLRIARRRGWVERAELAPMGSAELDRPAPRPRYSVLGLGRARALGLRLPHWLEALEAYLVAEEEGRDA